MNIFSQEYSQKLSSLSFYQNAKKEYSDIVTRLLDVVELPLQVAETLQFPDAHVVQSLNLSAITPAASTDHFKANYLEVIQLYAQRFAPHLTYRQGRQNLSFRLSEQMIENAKRVAYVYQEDQYWNKYFNDKYPKMGTIVNTFNSAKTEIESATSGSSARFLELVEARGNHYAHIKITDDALNSMTENVYTSNIRRSEQARRLKVPQIVRKFFTFTAYSLLLGEMYDGLKAEMDTHIASFYQRTEETRKAQFDIFNEWYKQNKVFTVAQIRELSEEAGLFMEDKGLESIVYPLETAPRVPIGAELYLYESKENSGTWFANIISPVVDPPIIDGYEDPVIGKVTGYGEGNIIIINEFFNVEMNMDLFKETFADYSDVYDGAREITADEQEVMNLIASVKQVQAEVASVEITAPETQAEAKAQESISLEDLLARHGIVPQQQAEVAPTATPLPEEAPAPTESISLEELRPSPAGFRVTRTGSEQYALSTSSSGLELGLTPDQLATRLLETNCIQGRPQIIQIDTDSTHVSSLTEPFGNMTSYLVM